MKRECTDKAIENKVSHMNGRNTQSRVKLLTDCLHKMVISFRQKSKEVDIFLITRASQDHLLIMSPPF